MAEKKKAEELPKLNVRQKQLAIQTELKAPKSQYNKFGEYRYRSCEDILEAVKPLLAKYNAVIDVSDELVLIGERYYIKATAALTCVESLQSVASTAYAREPDNKKGMDPSQITGATSSYAHKYALNGLLCIDDTKDADSNEVRKQAENTPDEEPLSKRSKSGPAPNPDLVEELMNIIAAYSDLEAMNDFSTKYKEKLAALSEEDKATVRKAYYDRQRELRK